MVDVTVTADWAAPAEVAPAEVAPAGATPVHPALTDPRDARTRDRVCRIVSEHGPLTAAAIAQRLGVTPAAVRRHLDALAAEGTVQERETAAAGRGRGRPARAYVLSSAGHRSLGNDYDDVATSALRYLDHVAGPEAVATFARERVGDLESRYAVQLGDAGTDVATRTAALAEALSTDGFAASTRPVGAGGPRSGVQLCQGHCPMQRVATEFPQFCDAETEAFSRLLGVHVQRLATLAHGEHVCTTFVPALPAERALQ